MDIFDHTFSREILGKEEYNEELIQSNQTK